MFTNTKDTLTLQDYLNFIQNVKQMKTITFTTNEDEFLFYYSMLSGKTIEDLKAMSIIERMLMVDTYNYLSEDIITDEIASPILEISSDEIYIIRKDFGSLSFEQFQNYDHYHTDAVKSENTLKNIAIQLGIVCQDPKTYSLQKAEEIAERILKMKLEDVKGPIAFFLSNQEDYMTNILSSYEDQIQTLKQQALTHIQNHLDNTPTFGGGTGPLYNLRTRTLLKLTKSWLKKHPLFLPTSHGKNN
jgi:hypothetical protein